MKRSASMLGLALLMAGAMPLAAQDTFGDWLSGNVALASDYRFRGISQSNQDPAISGGFDLRHPSGLYLGTWGGNVNFGEADLVAGPRGSLELDVYGGFGFELLPIGTFDIGALYYMYPGAGGARNYDYLELGLGASRTMGPLSPAVSLKWSPDFFAATGDALYYGVSLGLPVAPFTLSANVGQQNIEDNALFGTPDYLDWGVRAAVGVEGFTASARVVGTDIKKAECVGGSTICGTTVVFSLSRAM